MDEFGGLAGMVTLRDIIEHLVGDLPSYDEEFKQEIVEREDGSWLVDGLLPISEFKDFLDLDELPLEEKNGFQYCGRFRRYQYRAYPDCRQLLPVEWLPLRGC